jgi:hypothetical protein
MTTPTHVLPSPPADAVERLPLRLQLHPTMGVGATDGTWWPRSRDLDLELSDLVDTFPIALGEVHRAVYSRPDWDTAPRRVRVARGLIKVGSYPREDNHQVWLWMSTRTMIRLAVVAPEGSPTGPAGAATPDRPLVPDGVDEAETDARSHWDDDGGSWRAPPASSRPGRA